MTIAETGPAVRCSVLNLLRQFETFSCLDQGCSGSTALKQRIKELKSGS